MNEQAKKQQDGMVECEVCMKEIPASESMSDEASDYVMHFCGLECYGKWRQQSEDKNSKS